MVIFGEHIPLYVENGNKNRNYKRTKPRVKIKCEKCGKIFIEKADIFKKRFGMIGVEYCGGCSRKPMCRLSGLKGNYNPDGTLKDNTGRFTKEKWLALSDTEYTKRCEHNKKISLEYHTKLRNDPKLAEEHYKKQFQNSKIGYISRGQLEIYEHLKFFGFELEKQVGNVVVDLINYSKKIIIEYNGDYWHCNPRFWDENKYNKAIKMYAKEKWLKDRKRLFYLRGLGYEVHVIWENKWVNNRLEVFKLFKRITNEKYIIRSWVKSIPKPRKDKTYTEEYEVIKSELINGKTQKINKYYRITTKNDGVFYVTRLTDWRNNVSGSYSKKNIIDVISELPKNVKLWDGLPYKLNLKTDIICPHCGLSSSNEVNISRYHFNNCKNKKI